MWADLMEAGADREKLDGKSNKILVRLWQQWKPEQQVWPLAKARTKKWKPETKPKVWPMCLQDFLLDGEPTLP